MSRLLAVLFSLSFTTNLYAKKIQIIHTNDLHSYFFGYPELGLGGYARVKTVIDQLKEEAELQGIPSLIMDAGDFGEGDYFFNFNEGMPSFKLLGMLGIEVAVIGNHDYMFGGKMLGQQIRAVNGKTRFIAANMLPDENFNLRDILTGSTTFYIEGMKISVMGLTTLEPHFAFYFTPGLVLPVNATSKIVSKEIRDSGTDLLIALTHIGVSNDKSLITKDKNIDVVIGGHTHTRLEEIVYQKNSEGREIPIVQTGAHGLAVGSLIIDVKGPKDVEVVSYRLVDINETIPEDQIVADFVKEVERNAKEELGDGRWDEVVGSSEFNLTGFMLGKNYHDNDCWLRHVPNILREGTESDAGLYLGVFIGKYIYAGPITYGNIIENFQRVGNYGDKGWKIVSAKIKGWGLRSIFNFLLNYYKREKDVLTSGLTYSTFVIPSWIPWIGGKKYYYNFKIGGKKLKNKEEYTLAIPQEFIRLLYTIVPSKLRKYLPIEADEHFFWTWDLAEKYFRAHSPLTCELPN